MDTDIARILNLTENERNYYDEEALSDEISELKKELEKFYSTNARRLKLQSEYARLNYEIYESYMSTHQNAIAISGMYSELKIAGKALNKKNIEEIESILDSYLMFDALD